MTNYELYQKFLKTSTRHERRKAWLGISPVYTFRLQAYKQLAEDRVNTLNYTGLHEYEWLRNIIDWRLR